MDRVRPAILLASAALVACTAVGPRDGFEPPVRQVDPTVTSGTQALVGFVTLAGRLAIEGDADARASIVEDLAADARTEPTPSMRLRLAVGQTFTRLPPGELASARAALSRLAAGGGLTALERQIADICFNLMERQRRSQNRITTLEGQIEALTAIEQRIRDQDSP